MNGLKTIFAMIVAAVVVPILAKQGVTLTADQQAYAVGAGMAAVGIVMRLVSTGPAFAGFRAWFTKSFGSSGLAKLTPDEVNQLTNLIIRELKDRQAAIKAKETK